jgi:hypothetical protein
MGFAGDAKTVNICAREALEETEGTDAPVPSGRFQLGHKPRTEKVRVRKARLD